MLERINRLIQEVHRDPFCGVGKPEPLQPGYFIRSRDDGEAHCEAGRASRAKPIAEPIGAKRGPGMTARRPPAPVEARKPNRTDSQFAANPMSISAQLIFGAGLLECPGQHALSGFCSRRIANEHRMVYRVEGDLLQIAPLRHHY